MFFIRDKGALIWNDLTSALIIFSIDSRYALHSIIQLVQGVCVGVAPEGCMVNRDREFESHVIPTVNNQNSVPWDNYKSYFSVAPNFKDPNIGKFSFSDCQDLNS